VDFTTKGDCTFPHSYFYIKYVGQEPSTLGQPSHSSIWLVKLFFRTESITETDFQHVSKHISLGMSIKTEEETLASD
jgi:hypothetical protein